MFQDKFRKIVEGKNLSFEEAYELFNEMVRESPIRIGAMLTALQTKGYTAEEVAGFARAMRDNAIRVNADGVADTCGTGGDYSNTINVSTAVAIMLSCLNPVAKHGNVSVTSKSGSANVLEVLGIDIRLDADRAREMLEKHNFTFLFAPMYHPALKPVMPVRKELGIKTIFNILGPLCNPAEPSYQLLGVSSKDLLEVVSEALKMLGVEHALVVHGSGLDEVSPWKETMVAEVSQDIDFYRLKPEDFGVRPEKPKPCESAEESARRIEAVFSGKGLKEDETFVLINASAAFYSCGIVGDFKEGIDLAKSVIEEGKAARKLEELRKVKQ